MRFYQILFSILSLFAATLHSADYEDVSKEIALHMLPERYLVKKTLDEIMASSKTSVFHDLDSMTAAGFDYVEPQPTTGIIVTRHPKLQGYIIKAYLDTQEYYGGRPEYYYWVKRAQGANLIRGAIKKYHYEHLIKVPRKFIYSLPDFEKKPLPPNCKPKRYILIEDDMNILDDAESKKRWSSPHVTKELLLALHTIITEFRFRDCAKPANCPFSYDGRVALVDTQSFYKNRIGYKKLTPYLSPEMQVFWKSLSSRETSK